VDIKNVNIKCYIIAPSLHTSANKTNYYLSIYDNIKSEILQLYYQKEIMIKHY